KPADQQAEEDYARRSEEEYNRLTQQHSLLQLVDQLVFLLLVVQLVSLVLELELVFGEITVTTQPLLTKRLNLKLLSPM
ncbi:hypothetical protein RIT80_11405, partial [Streptococcus pneumoniae]|uniref:hypothetical protein n=1 Tax=Streptococcus pneumoniae TaxID=1313 RepID=UPI00285D743E